MKDIMARESSSKEQGVPSFEYNPADYLPRQSLLFQLSRPLDDLRDMLLEDFAGRTVTMAKIYEEHNVGKRYVKPNYKEALKALAESGKILARKADGRKRRRGTFADDVLAIFPCHRNIDMATKSTIEWTESTWNPVTGCSKISEGCVHCYAQRLAMRLKAMGQKNYINGFDVTLHPQMLETPLRWKKSQMIFVNSMSDLFHNSVPLSFVRQVFDVMNEASWHTFQALTKRAERLADLAPSLPWSDNIWMGVTIESAAYLYRLDFLRNTPAAVRFLSLEPLLGPIPEIDLENIDWVIVGGESGPGARPMDKKWVIDIQRQCQEARVPFFFKQWGGVNKRKSGRLLNGRTYDETPYISNFGSRRLVSL